MNQAASNASKASRAPVLIIGAGPTGLLLAIELLRRSVPVVLIEKHPGPTRWSQAIFIKQRTLDILQDIGLRDRFYAQGQEIRWIEYFSEGVVKAKLDVSLVGGRNPCILSIAESITVEILGDEVRRLGGEIIYDTEFLSLAQTEETVEVRLQGPDGVTTVTASWAIGADGSHSTVRTAINVDYEGQDFPETWAIFDAELYNWPAPPDTAVLQLDLPLVAPYPMLNGVWRIMFGPYEETGDDLEHVLNGLRNYGPETTMGAFGAVQHFHAHARLADKLRVGRVFLAGDAAHATNPMDGHGMNAGMQDAYNLGWKLAYAWHGLATEALLASYDIERRAVDDIAIQAGIKTAELLRDRSGKKQERMHATISNPETQHDAALRGSELAWSYDKSDLIEDAHPKGSGKAGTVIPNSNNLLLKGEPVSLHDLATHGGFTVLILTADSDPSDLTSQISPVIETFSGTQMIAFCRGSAADQTEFKVLSDHRGELHDHFCATQPMICVIRPDQHISYLGSTSPDDLKTHLAKMLKTEAETARG